MTTEESVKINDDNFGSRNPNTVLLNTGFTSGGIEALIVNRKNDVGHKKCVSTT
jgi:hypothetical protein